MNFNSYNISRFNQEKENFPSRIGTAFGSIFAFLFIAFGLFGNFLISFAILSKSKLRKNVTNIFIFSLQMNDIFNICFNCLPVAFSYA
jgi:hypothetical protein